MTSRRTKISPKSGRGLGHVTPTIFGSNVGYPSDSLASCLVLQWPFQSRCRTKTSLAKDRGKRPLRSNCVVPVCFCGRICRWRSVRSKSFTDRQLIVLASEFHRYRLHGVPRTVREKCRLDNTTNNISARRPLYRVSAQLRPALGLKIPKLPATNSPPVISSPSCYFTISTDWTIS